MGFWKIAKQERARQERERRRVAALENPRVDVSSFEAEREVVVARIDADRRARESELPARAIEPAVCELHGWSPPVPFVGAPRPPKSECSHCLAEVDAKRDPERPRIVVDAVRGALTPKQLTKAEILWEERQRAEGKVIPGSEEERLAVEYNDDQRAKAIAADRGQNRRGSPVWQKFEDGRIVTGGHSARTRRAWKRRGSSSFDEPSWPDIRRRLRMDRQPLFNEKGEVIGYA